jgi:hypothetical protein
LVSTVRQNQKTDKNDALAIIQAALLPDISFISDKMCRAAAITIDTALKGVSHKTSVP